MKTKNSLDHGIARYHDLPENTDTSESLKQVYADWAEGYDHDNDHTLGTVSQPNSVALLARHLTNRDAQILDIGCGTGLVGKHLSKHGFTTFDGTDLSSEMLEQARKRGYRNLFTADATQPLDIPDDTYDATICVGVFTHGHLEADSFQQLTRLTKPNGIIVFTVNEGVWETGGFQAAIDRLASQEIWRVLENTLDDYMTKEDVKAWYVAAQKI